MLYELNDRVINNILTFLNRSGTRNFKELEGMNEILYILKNPIKNEKSNNDNTK